MKPQCSVPCQQFSRHNSAALCWRHSTLALPATLLVKTAGSTHFPVFFCQLWEKALISFLPPRHWPWRRCEKPSLRATAPHCVPSRQSELLSLVFVSLNSVVLPLRRNKKLLCGFLDSFRWNKYCLICCHLFV